MSFRRVPVHRRLALLAPMALIALLTTACGRHGPDGAAAAASGASGASPAALAASAAAAAASAPVQLVAPEDVRTVEATAHAAGPVITGSIQPERRADLRAEVSAVVLQVLKENGEVVRRGELLVRLDDTAIRDSLASAQESARAAEQSFDQSERQYQRLRTLQAQGMTSTQALEDAEVRRNNAQSDVVAAKARVASALQQRQRTEVRAPFDGIVSERKVSAGDTAQVGKELVKVIDPASMRFEGLVSADRMREVQAGQMVQFRVNGIENGDFTGKVRRVDASADPTTRQLSVLVDFTQGTPPRVAGLYAEGQIAIGSQQAVMLPEESIAREGDQAFVWRLDGGRIVKTPIKLGERDARRGAVVVASGLAAGQQILRNPAATLVDGQRFERTRAAPPAASVAGS